MGLLFGTVCLLFGVGLVVLIKVLEYRNDTKRIPLTRAQEEALLITKDNIEEVLQSKIDLIMDPKSE